MVGANSWESSIRKGPCNTFRKMSFEFNPNENLNRSEDVTTTPKTMIALEVRESPLAEESLAYPKWLEHATTKTM